MSKRISFWLPWLIWVLFLVITFFTELLSVKNASFELLDDIFYDLVLLIFVTVGAFIASHRPKNPNLRSLAYLGAERFLARVRSV